jgi:hypothetical protein
LHRWRRIERREAHVLDQRAIDDGDLAQCAHEIVQAVVALDLDAQDPRDSAYLLDLVEAAGTARRHGARPARAVNARTSQRPAVVPQQAVDDAAVDAGRGRHVVMRDGAPRRDVLGNFAKTQRHQQAARHARDVRFDALAAHVALAPSVPCHSPTLPSRSTTLAI